MLSGDFPSSGISTSGCQGRTHQLPSQLASPSGILISIELILYTLFSSKPHYLLPLLALPLSLTPLFLFQLPSSNLPTALAPERILLHCSAGAVLLRQKRIQPPPAAKLQWLPPPWHEMKTLRPDLWLSLALLAPWSPPAPFFASSPASVCPHFSQKASRWVFSSMKTFLTQWIPLSTVPLPSGVFIYHNTCKL